MYFVEDGLGLWTLCGYLIEFRGRQYIYILGKQYEIEEYCELLKNSLDLDVLAEDFQ